MRRFCFVFLSFVFSLVLVSCSNGRKKIVDMDTLIARSEAESSPASSGAAESGSGDAEKPQEAESSSVASVSVDAPVYTDINLDLTKQSATVVYSQVFNMMVEPETFVGKKIRLNGIATAIHDEEENKDYFACIVMDATACCAQGIEFELPENMQSPEFYPKDGDEITVTGVFEMYESHGFDAFRLGDAVWTREAAL